MTDLRQALEDARRALLDLSTRNRLLSLKEDRESSYIDIEAVREETVTARRLYERQGWPVIDVTRRSVEETAAAVLNLLHGGHGQVEVLG